MRLLYKFTTRVGTFYIGQSADGRFHPIYDNENLGSYAHPRQAAEDLAGGHTFSVPGVEDTSVLGIPDNHSEWEPINQWPLSQFRNITLESSSAAQGRRNA